MIARWVGVIVGGLILVWIVGSSLSALGVVWWLSILIMYALISAGLLIYCRRIGQPLDRTLLILYSVPAVAAIVAIVLPIPYDLIAWAVAGAWFIAWYRHYTKAARQAEATEATASN